MAAVGLVEEEEEVVSYDSGHFQMAWECVIPGFLVKFTNERKLVTDRRTDQ